MKEKTLLKHVFGIFFIAVSLVLFTACDENVTKPPLPVNVMIRPSLLKENQYVAIIANNSSQRIVFTATFVSEDETESKTFTVIVDGQKNKEIGWMEGWVVAYGQTLYLSAEGYSDGVFAFTKENARDVVR